jgi:hypothetical protein
LMDVSSPFFHGRILFIVHLKMNIANLSSSTHGGCNASFLRILSLVFEGTIAHTKNYKTKLLESFLK